MPRKGVVIPLASLLLLAGCFWLWARSGDGGHAVALFGNGGRVGGLVSSRGQVLLVVTNVPLDPRRAWTAEVGRFGDDDAQVLIGLLDNRAEFARRYGRFAWMRGTFAEFAGSWFTAVGVPHGLLVGLLAIPPLPGLVRWWTRWRRGRRGMCLACGYDLRQSPGRCPECGWERAEPLAPAT